MTKEQKPEGVRRVPVLALGWSSAATVLSRWRRQLRLTVIAKATFTFAPQSEMTPAEPLRIFAREVHHDENPAKSIRAPSDLAPHLERAQAIFVGTAHGGGSPQQRVDVRFAIGAVHGVLMDKRLVVEGDRRANPPGQPTSFTKMPLVYERAYGGIGFPENPLGPGIDTSAKLFPNITYAEASRAREPAGLGPISSLWPSRKRLLKGIARKELDARIIELPDEFTFDYFQAVPQDQQIRALEGREWIVLEGVSARHPMLHMRLPWARAAAIVYGPGVPTRPFELTADTLYVDGDAERCSITYRASIPLPSEEIVEGLAVAAGVELVGRPLEWPLNLVADELRAIAGPDSTHGRGDFVSGTLSIEDLGQTRTAQSMPPPERVLPFVAQPGTKPSKTSVEAPIPGAPWTAPDRSKAPVAPLAGSPFESTIALDVDEPAPLTLPVPQAPPPPQSAAKSESKKDPWLPAPPPPEKQSPKPEARPAIAPVPPEHKQSLYRKIDKG
jgi:hypothetical protein